MGNFTEADLLKLQKRGLHISEKITLPPSAAQKELAAAQKATGVKKKREHPEHDAQAEFIAWCAEHKGKHWQLDWFFAVPNGGYRAWSEKAGFVAEGVKSGVPDLLNLIPHGGYNFLAIEVKTSGNKKPKPNQLKWHAHLSECGGLVVVAVGLAEIKAAACRYFEISDLDY
jgi:hypothetical protein